MTELPLTPEQEAEAQRLAALIADKAQQEATLRFEATPESGPGLGPRQGAGQCRRLSAPRWRFAEPAEPDAGGGNGPATAGCETCSAPSRRNAVFGWHAPHDCWYALAALPGSPGTPPSGRT